MRTPPRLAAALAALWPALGHAQTPQPGAAALPRDLSPWSMAANADPVVQGVLALLLLASVLTWTIGLAKGLQLLRARRAARRGLAILRGAPDLAAASAQVADHTDCGTLLRVATAEADVSGRAARHDGVKERTAWRLDRDLNGFAQRIAAGTGVLATVGSVSPFVGLFGTVWGIMGSFIGISRAQTTNLAVVAPGIAEALLATAVGLVAAIPAVVIYNLFARGVAGHKAVLADAAAEIMRLLSRDLDRAGR